MFTEALDQPAHDGDAGVETQLLEGYYVGESLEQVGESRRPHPAQRQGHGAKPALAPHYVDCAQQPD